MSLDPIINVRFKKFREHHELINMPDGEAFERFVNHAIFGSHQPDAFSADNELFDKVCVGGNNDMGIDGLGIKLNGLFVRNVSDVKDILSRFRRANVEFIFVQSKYKPFFDKGEFNNFVAGVRDFLSQEPLHPMNDRIQEMQGIKEYLLSDDAVVMWEKSPMVRLYYVAMGVWRNSPHQLALAEQLKRDLGNLNTFDDVEVHFIDRDALKNICDNNENTFNATLHAIDTMSLTEVAGVSDSCVALCYASELIKLLTTEEGLIRKSLFDDNVRDFQGPNTINKEIELTIKNDPTKFVLLNNGITIVCDEYVASNRNLTVKNPQIVNGCQTSHVIYYAYKNGNDISKVPLNIKIISTSDTAISNQILRGCNRQNIVLDEAFETTKQFHKDLEDYTTAISNEYEKIYYERRSKQYVHNPTIKLSQKFNLRVLSQAFVAMMLNKPHMAHRHESKLLDEFPNEIYQEHHSKLPYFTAAYSFLKFEQLIRDSEHHPLWSNFDQKKEFQTFRAHLLMLFRELISGPCPNISSETAIEEHCLQVLKVLKSRDETIRYLKGAIELFISVKNKWIKELNKSPHGIKDIDDFAILLLSEVRKRTASLKRAEIVDDENHRYQGRVMRVLIDRNGYRFGFIQRQPENIFFHANTSRGLDWIDIEGKQVSYRVSTNPKDGRLVAVDVSRIK